LNLPTAELPVKRKQHYATMGQNNVNGEKGRILLGWQVDPGLNLHPGGWRPPRGCGVVSGDTTP